MTKEQLRQHLLSAPPGTTPGGIVAALRSQGVQMEGDPMVPQRGLLEPVPLDQGPSIGGFAQNVAKSAGRLIQGVGSAVIHPIQSVENVAKLGIGAAANTLETLTGNEQLFNAPGEQLAHNVGQNFVDRYSDKGIAKTLYEDPVGAASDVATAITAAGGVAKLAGASQIGSELSSLGSAADPVANASRVAGTATEAAVNGLSKPLAGRAEKLYQSALKPTAAVRNDFPDVVQTGLKNGIILSKGSLGDVKGMLEGIRQDIDGHIEAAAQQGGPLVLTEDVIGRMARAKKFFSQVPGGSKYVQQLDDLAETFLKEQGQSITVGKAQAIKKSTYQMINDSYGQLEKAHTEGLKDIARGLKEEIVTKVPEIKDLNLKQSELMGLEKALNDFTRRTGNRQSVDLATGIGTVTGMAATGLKGAAKGFATGKMLKAFMDDPAFKSWRALVYFRLGKGVEFSGKTSSVAGKASEVLRSADLINHAQ